MIRNGIVTIKLYLQKQLASQIWSMGYMEKMMLGFGDIKIISRSSYTIFGKEINKYDEIGSVLC